MEHSTAMLPPFISATWLAEHRGDVLLADVRFYLDGRDPRATYDEAHIPGAIYLDLHHWLAGAPSPEHGRHPLPTPEHFAEGLGQAGIGDDTTVIAYDDAGGVIAARLVWMLRTIGHPAALLDGGLSAWPGQLTTTPAAPQPQRFAPRPWPTDRLATIEEIAAHLEHPENRPILIDARQRERYAGQPDGIDPRSGHIPTAHAIPTREHLGPNSKLLPTTDLRATFATAGITESTQDVISYCGSGVTACHNLLVLEHAGLGTHRLYPGSWSQWSHTDLPIETSSDA